MKKYSGPFRKLNFRQEFFSEEAVSGILLFVAAVVALILANSPFGTNFNSTLQSNITVSTGLFEISETVRWWVNDGLMTLFFFLVGMEIKREILEDQLSEVRRAVLPGLAAIGGILVPICIYLAINLGAPENFNGWAIPAATDIAFALGVLAFLAHRMPGRLRVLLLAIAVIDDLAAILIIATAYTDHIQPIWFSPAVCAAAILFALNRFSVASVAPYVLIGILLWFCVLKAGIHPTLTGIAVAFSIPLRIGEWRHEQDSPLRDLESGLHPWVAYGILPVFALSNAGISFEGIGLETLYGTAFIGIVLGLIIGKPLGVIGAAWIGIQLGWCRIPRGVSWRQYCGMASLTGIGFTMSLFIGTLAFPGEKMADVRTGVMVGSVISAIIGVLLLRFVAPTATESKSKTIGHENNGKTSKLSSEVT